MDLPLDRTLCEETERSEGRRSSEDEEEEDAEVISLTQPSEDRANENDEEVNSPIEHWIGRPASPEVQMIGVHQDPDFVAPDAEDEVVITGVRQGPPMNTSPLVYPPLLLPPYEGRIHYNHAASHIYIPNHPLHPQHQPMPPMVPIPPIPAVVPMQTSDLDDSVVVIEQPNAKPNDIGRQQQADIDKAKAQLKCPLCLCAMETISSTKCGHVYCKECITLAIRSLHACPLCQCALSLHDIHPLYL